MGHVFLSAQTLAQILEDLGVYLILHETLVMLISFPNWTEIRVVRTLVKYEGLSLCR
jgi:hypothetical protein